MHQERVHHARHHVGVHCQVWIHHAHHHVWIHHSHHHVRVHHAHHRVGIHHAHHGIWICSKVSLVSSVSGRSRSVVVEVGVGRESGVEERVVRAEAEEFSIRLRLVLGTLLDQGAVRRAQKGHKE